MLNVERLLQWNIAGVVVVGALLLGFGNRDFLLPSLAAGTALFSLIFVDKLQWFVLNRFAANFVALLVAVLPLLDFFSESNEDQLLSIARLLIHLQMVLLLEKKTPRIYWQLFVLSVLQVVVAAALRLDLEGGVLFLLYVLLDFSAMTLMLLHRDVDRVQTSNQLAQVRHRENLALLRGKIPARGLRAPAALSFEQKLPTKQYVRRLLPRAVLLTGMALAFATFLFYSVPRTGDPWFGARIDGGSLIGFSDSIRFNQTTNIGRSTQRVMRIKLLEPTSGRALRLDGGLYLRGTTLERYGMQDGIQSWNTETRRREEASQFGMRPLPALRDNDNYLIQLVTLEPTSQPYLFSLFPARALDEATARRVNFNVFSNSLLMADEPQDRNDLKFELAVTHIRREIQSPTYPYLNPYTSTNEPMGFVEDSKLMFPVQVGKGPDLSYIAQLAKTWAKETADPNNRLLVALHLQDRLRNDPSFEYTLDFRNVPRDKSLDPIVDFLKNHRQGHCEYFASSLALMLRSLGIPARLVVGYHCDLYNTLGSFYEVQQQHAHVWVEAYLSPEDVTQDMIDRGDASAAGAWLRLDPTPSSDSSETDDSELLARADNALGYAQMLWEDFVVGLDAEKQESSLFGGSWSNLLDSSYWNSAFARVSFNLQQLQENPVQTGAWLALAAVLFMLVAILRRRLRRKTMGDSSETARRARWRQTWAPRLSRLLRRPEPGTQHAMRIDFYERFETLLKQHGLERRGPQTVREFAQSITPALKDTAERSDWQPSLETLLNAFDQVRYAQRELDTQQRQHLEQALQTLEQQLTPSVS